VFVVAGHPNGRRTIRKGAGGWDHDGAGVELQKAPSEGGKFDEATWSNALHSGAFGLTCSHSARGRDATASGKPDDPPRPKTKLQHLKGKISDDGKSFTTDKDNKTYTIDNSDAVKGHEGHDVRLSGHVDASNNSIHVTSVTMASEKKPMSEQPPK
jgi:hypothetical protein